MNIEDVYNKSWYFTYVCNMCMCFLLIPAVEKTDLDVIVKVFEKSSFVLPVMQPVWKLAVEKYSKSM